MKDLYFGLSALAFIATLFVFLGSRTRQRLIIAAAPVTSTPLVVDAPLPTVRRVADDHWLVFLTARTGWYDTGIPMAAGFEVWVEPEKPSVDCQFLLQLRSQIYSSEFVAESSSPQTQQMLVAFPWQGFPLEDLSWVDTIRLKLSDSCRKTELLLNVETRLAFVADDPLETSEEFAEHRQRILAGHRLAAELRRLFDPLPEKK